MEHCSMRDRKSHRGTGRRLKRRSQKESKVVLATGRSFEGVIPYLKELGLEEEGNYTISCCGALGIDNKTHKELYSVPIEHSDVLQILKMCEEYDLDMSAYTREEIIVHQDHLFSRYDAIANNAKLITMDFHNLPDDLKLYKINLVNEAPEMKQDMVDYFPMIKPDNYDMREKEQFNPRILDDVHHFPKHLRDAYTIVKSLPFCAEILKKECNKSVGVREVAAKYGINRDEIICIGDSDNDYHMVEYAGLGVAMANAYDSVKSVADEVTLSNSEDGVAHIVEKYLNSSIHQID